MATRIRINKVNELPLALEPSALYMVKGVHPDHFEFHVASSDGLSTLQGMQHALEERVEKATTVEEVDAIELTVL